MNAPVPGWYQDPGGSPHLRWWDGYQWTHDVAPMPQVAPQPQPQPQPVAAAAVTPEPARPSVADAPPGTVLFDEKIGGVGVSGRQLRITPEQITWGKESVPLDQVTGVSFAVVKQSVNGVPAGTQRFFAFAVPGGTWKIPLHSNKLRPATQKYVDHFDRLLDISEQLIEPRLCAAALAGIEAGGSFRVAKVTLDRSGIRTEGLRSKQMVPWSAVTGVDLSRGQVVISVVPPAKPIGIGLDQSNAIVAARVVAAAAARFA